MRLKIILPLLLAGVVGITVLLLLRPAANRPQPPTAPPAAQPAVVLPQTPPIIPPAVRSSNVTTSNPARLVASLPFITGKVEGDNAEYIQAQINRLEDLQSNDDDASLQAILKELTNTNPIIRHVAIEAAIQFGGHTAVPVLRDLASRTWDAAEKQELLDAADFLALPTIYEVRDQKRLERLQGAGQP